VDSTRTSLARRSPAKTVHGELVGRAGCLIAQCLVAPQ
jgi:hypothetical protein